MKRLLTLAFAILAFAAIANASPPAKQVTQKQAIVAQNNVVAPLAVAFNNANYILNDNVALNATTSNGMKANLNDNKATARDVGSAANQNMQANDANYMTRTYISANSDVGSAATNINQARDANYAGSSNANFRLQVLRR